MSSPTRSDPFRPVSRYAGQALLVGILAAFCLPNAGISQQVGDGEVVIQYLERLGMDDLQVLQLERLLEQSVDEPSRLRWGRKLADAYAGQLMDAGDQADESAAIHARIDRLLERVPQADSDSLRVMLLQADYYQAERLASTWTADRRQQDAANQAAEILRRIAPQLHVYRRRLGDEVEAVRTELDGLPEQKAREAKEREARRLQPLAGRAAYFAGWANYYLAVTDSEFSGQSLERSREAFRSLLEIEGAYQRMDASMLGLESVWRSRAVIGLGLAEAAVGDLRASRACFSLLEQPTVPPDIQDQASYWYLQGLLNANLFEEAASFARAKINSLNGEASPGRASFFMALAAAGFSAEKPDASQTELSYLGIEGLTRIRQQHVAIALLKKFDVQLADDAGFFTLWLRGHRKMAAAEASDNPQDFRAAIAELAAALESADAKREVQFAGQCRFEMGWCQFQVGEYQAAASSFSSAVAGLKSADRQRASQSAWMAFVAYQNLAETQPQFVASALEALRKLRHDFPESTYADKAEHYSEKLRRDATPPEETIRRLERVAPNAENYVDAKYDICVLLHELWLAAERDRQAFKPRMRRAVDAYLQAARGDQDPGRKLESVLLFADIAVNTKPVEPAVVETYLDLAEAFAERLPRRNPHVAEYHYRRLQMASLLNQSRQRFEHAEWLVRNATGSLYEVPALVVVASALDVAPASATEAEAAERRGEALAMYDRLSRRLGDSPETLKNQKNARVALSRAAQLAEDLGKHEDAARRLAKLLAAFPEDKSYLRRLGESRYRTGQFERSLSCWRTLLAGLNRQSDDWYQAKYHQLACLLEIEPTKGRRVFQQFELLDPDLGPTAWRDKFAALKRRYSAE